MAVSVVPHLIDALIAGARAAVTDATVYDGVGNSDNPGDFLMIGVEDPDAQDASYSAEAQQTWANANYTARDETGDITCCALSWNGNGNEAGQKQARDAAYSLANAVEDMCRANPAFDLDEHGLMWTGFGASTQFSQIQGEQGSLAQLVFRISFRSRI